MRGTEFNLVSVSKFFYFIPFICWRDDYICNNADILCIVHKPQGT